MRALPHKRCYLAPAHTNANAREGVVTWVTDKTPRGPIRPSAFRPPQVSPCP